MLGKPSLPDMLGAAVWKLDPVLKKVAGNPKDGLVDAFASFLHLRVARFFLSLGKATNRDPIVFLSTENLATEAQGLSTRHHCQTLK